MCCCRPTEGKYAICVPSCSLSRNHYPEKLAERAQTKYIHRSPYRPLCSSNQTVYFASLNTILLCDELIVLLLRFGSSRLGRDKNFLFSVSSRPVLGPTHPPLRRVPEVLFSGVKWTNREADHLPPTNAEIKKTWIYTSTPQYVMPYHVHLCLVS
jgi:hypothetical protein